MSFTVQKDVEEGKIKINHVGFFALKIEFSYFKNKLLSFFEK